MKNKYASHSHSYSTVILLLSSLDATPIFDHDSNSKEDSGSTSGKKPMKDGPYPFSERKTCMKRIQNVGKSKDTRFTGKTFPATAT